MEMINTQSDEEFLKLYKKLALLFKKHIEEASPFECKKLILKLEKYIWDWDEYESKRSICELIDSVLEEYYKAVLINRLPFRFVDNPIYVGEVRKLLNSELGKEAFLDAFYCLY